MMSFTFTCARCKRRMPLAGRKKYKVIGRTVDGRKKINHQCEECYEAHKSEDKVKQ